MTAPRTGIQRRGIGRREPVGGVLFGAVALFAFSVPQPALADAEDTVNLVAQHTLQRDDNLFRVPKGVVAIPGSTDRGDYINSSLVGISLNKPYSLQRFELNLNLNSTRYQNYSFLNFEATNYKAAWRWSLLADLKGNLTTERKQSFGGFVDYRNFANKIITTNKLTTFDLDWQLRSGWHLMAGVNQATLNNSQIVVENGDAVTDTVFGGIRYTFTSGSDIWYVRRASDGKYLNRSMKPATMEDNAFRLVEDELRLIWNVTGKSTVTARLAHLSRTHEHFEARNFSGNAGGVTWTWTPTGKLQLQAGATRDRVAWWDTTTANSSFTVNDKAYVGPVWQLGAKTSLRARYEVSRREFLGPVPTFGHFARLDRGKSVQIGLDWTPLRTVTISGFAQHERRDTNVRGLEYDANSVGVSAQAQF